jgi:hypothetical protein
VSEPPHLIPDVAAMTIRVCVLSRGARSSRGTARQCMPGNSQKQAAART